MAKTPEEIKRAKKQLIPNERLETPLGFSRILIPGRPSLPIPDNNYGALCVIASSLGGNVEFVSDLPVGSY
jgi:hypothetical protein